MPEDPRLIALAAAVSDGAPVDWARAEQDAGNPEARLLVCEMRRLATIVTAHRSGGLGPGDSDDDAEPPSPVRHWRHIVLFEPVGAGAFGTVYRGWDPRLDREVAVKLLPRGIPGTSSPLEEARHLARIRHSNIVVVYGADTDGDEAGIWMEYIEGQTLADMIRTSGPMSAREAIGVGVDLCRALAALHGAGLLHRDIKAHNIMRETGGRIVLMDFSGAQAVEREVQNTSVSGTPLYMAPELFDGAPASFASEVYSLGVLLFFLLSGRLPVEANTVPELRRAHAEARRTRLRDLRSDVPESIVRVIERAITPDVSLRYQTAGELEHALMSASGAHVESRDAIRVPARSGQKQSSIRQVLWMSLALIIGAIGAGTGFIASQKPAATPLLTRFTIGPPYLSGSWPRISPDGRMVVFGAIVEGRNRFWVRPLDGVEGRPLMNTAATESPFWSPDSRWLCFFADGKLKRVPLNGTGEAEILADAPQPHGGDWHDRSIIFSRDDGVYRIALDGGTGTAISQVTTLDRSMGDYQHGWPEFLPDGRRFIFIIRSSRPDRTGLYLGSLDGGTPRLVMPAFSRVVFAAGHLLFVRQGNLVAQRFDDAKGRLEGQSMPLADRVKYHQSSDAAFDASDTGVLVYGQNAGERTSRLILMDGRGRELGPIAPAGYYRHPRFSPDGTRIVAEKVGEDRNVDLWLYDIARRSAARLTSSDAPDEPPTWSPDGRRVVFSSKRGGLFDVYSKTVDTTEPEHPFVTLPGDKFVEHWSRDGRFLTGTVLRSGLWLFPVDPKEKPRLLHADAKTENWQSQISPDGRWLAYTSCASGTPEVYVEPFPATGSRWQVSTDGGVQPHWRRGGSELLYLTVDGMLTSVSLTDGSWQKSHATPLFHVAVPDLLGSGDYTVSPDGERIVVNTFIADPLVPPIDVVVNWTALLAR
jgi:serine/threonine protein kinase/Tol biopolymer transport system component